MPFGDAVIENELLIIISKTPSIETINPIKLNLEILTLRIINAARGTNIGIVEIIREAKVDETYLSP